MKTYKFNIGEYCLVNDKAKNGLPDRVGQICEICDYKEGEIYDYSVIFSDGSVTKVKENELFKLKKQPKFKFAEKIKIHNIDKKAFIKDIILDTMGTEVKYKYKLLLNNSVEEDKMLENKIFEEHEISSEENNNFIYINNPSNKETHRRILEELHDLYLKKNADYGDSFKKLYDEYGILSVIIRLEDKLNRLKQLEKKQAQVKSESIRDTAIDLANYAIMLIMELDRENNKKE